MIFVFLLCLIFNQSSYANDDLPLLALPITVTNASTVLLKCGRVYSGELNLEGKSHVSVKTEGACGPAMITMAVPVTGWRREIGNKPIWSAAISFQPAQVEVGGRFMELAHFPHSPQIWMKAVSQRPSQLAIQLPNNDVVGASLVWKAHDWLILVDSIVRYESRLLTIATNKHEEFSFPPVTSFFIEGKCWMLDAPGEWCVEQGRLYVWAHDSGSPEARAVAAPKGRAINVNNTNSISIENIKINIATIGIEANNINHLSIRNTQFQNIGDEAIIAGGTDIQLEDVRIIQTGLNGIRFTDDARQIIVKNSYIQGAGMLGMPKRSKAAIVLEQAQQANISGNTIVDSAYIGIRIFRNSVVEKNTIVRACLRLTDCSGIYTFARDGLPLNTTIINNSIRDTHGSLTFGIYLDDQANHVQVLENNISNNSGGMQLHNTFNNLIQDNYFYKNKNQQILFNETSHFSVMHDNKILKNKFDTDEDVPVYRLWSALGASTIGNFGWYSANAYKGGHKEFAECAGSGMINWEKWKLRMKDTSSFK